MNMNEKHTNAIESQSSSSDSDHNGDADNNNNSEYCNIGAMAALLRQC